MKSNTNSRYVTSASYDQPSSVTTFPVEPDNAYLGKPRTEASRLGGCLQALGRALAWGLFAAIALAVLGCTAAFVGYFLLAATLPSAEDLASTHMDQSTKIYDRNGGLLFEIFDPNGGRRTLVPPEKLPLVLKQASISTEDPSFYTNWGVDPVGIARAIYYDVRYGSAVVGGSTITQQLVKNTLLTPEPTVQRKLREAVLAVEITRRYSKDQILAFYLNTIYFGNYSYGIEAASQSYFKKDVSQLDLAEASLLAGIPQAPSYYDPCENPDSALDRQTVVLQLMEKQGFVSASQSAAAQSEMDTTLHSSDFSDRCKAPITMTSPHFVEFVRQRLEQDPNIGPEKLYKAGLQVYTTLDPTMQKIVEDEASKQIAALKGNNVSSAAVVAANPQNGEILAMLGSVNFYDKSIDGQVNVATSLRQPGSSIKPVNYVTAFEKGWTPATPLYDLRTQFPNGSAPPYVPVDYDGKEHGIVSTRIALANSLNIPAVKTLYFVGVKNMIATAQQMGITTFKDPNQYGLALTLGGGEVKLAELTGAYAVFANQGRRVPLTPYRKLVDGQGNVLLDTSQQPTPAEKVLDPRYAYLITSILSDNAARTMEFGPNSPLRLSRTAAAKTGTTNDFKDNWTLGYTPELVVGVWVGNPRNQAMKNVSGIAGAAPIWHNVMERAYKEDDQFRSVAPHDFPIPGGLVRANVCRDSGLLATDLCPPDHRVSEIFLAEQAPKQPDNVWVKLKIDKTNGLLANDQCPPDIVDQKLFEKIPHDVGDLIPYDQLVKWANDHGMPQPPTQPSPCTSGTPQPTPVVEVKIYQPTDGEKLSGIVTVNGSATVVDFADYTLEIGRGDQRVQIGAGNSPVYPHGRLATFDSHAFQDGGYTIWLTVADHNNNRSEDSAQVTIQNKQPDTPTPTATATPPATMTPTPRPTPTVQPGEIIVQDNNPAVKYNGNWLLVGDQRAWGGTYHDSSDTSATASVGVSGAQSFQFVTIVGIKRGIVNVLIDGNLYASFDTYAPVQKFKAVSPLFALPDGGEHIISIQVSGNKNPLSGGDAVALDAFVIYQGSGPHIPQP